MPPSTAAPHVVPTIAQIAAPVPLTGLFDYLIPPALQSEIQVGVRVHIPFGRRQLTGVVMGLSTESDYDLEKLKPIDAVLDRQPTLYPEIQSLCQRASQYYHHPIGEVVNAALPNALGQGKALSSCDEPAWRLSPQGQHCQPEALSNAPKQRHLLLYFQQQASKHSAMPAKPPPDQLRDQLKSRLPSSLTRTELKAFSPNWRTALKGLEEKGYIESCHNTLIEPPEPQYHPPHGLNDEQHDAVGRVLECSSFHCFLLNGVTGSGKTEVYLQISEQHLKAGKRVLILVPEIGLTPQLIARFEQRFGPVIQSLHSNMTDTERLKAWKLASQGHAWVVIGTRSALFTPIPNLGLVIIDEEHDSSLKQQEGFRYHARDLAMMRAQDHDIPIVMGSATPSLESLYNVALGRYTELNLKARAGKAISPRIAVIDSRKKAYGKALSEQLKSSIKQHLQQGKQVLLFLNRRGYAPSLSCPSCGWHAQCQRCDASMTLHYQPYRLRCHHCGNDQQVEPHCPECSYKDLETIGLGTEQLEQELNQDFPNYTVLRIDRDSTRRKGSLETYLKAIHDGQAQILIGTQMLAKGHHFPDVTLVGILDCDRGLFSADFRGTEQMAQMILQVSGRAGRAETPGEVLIQSAHPDSAVLHTLVTQGYREFSIQCMEERKAAILPPYTYMALFRSEAIGSGLALDFLREIATELHYGDDVLVLGPIPAPMEKRAGRYRAQLMLQSQNRKGLHYVLQQIRHKAEQSKMSRRVRWSLDVDPTDVF